MAQNNANANSGALERFFSLKKNKTDVKTEVLAGVTTFVAMAYILFVNPSMLADPFRIMGDNAFADQVQNGVFFATCLVSFFGTFMMAVYAKVPFAQAPGMGLNAFFAYTVILTMGYTYGEALATVFISGILFIVITAVGFREAVVRAIPPCVKDAITPGIGLFLALVGLKNANLVVSNGSTFVGMIDFSLWREAGNAEGMLTAGGVSYSAAAYHQMIAGAVIALIGLIVIAALHVRKVKGSIIIGILVATVIGIPFGITSFHGLNFNFAQQFSDFLQVSFFKMDFAGLFKGSTSILDMIFTIIMVVISFSLVDMFDTIGTLLGTAKQANMLDENGEWEPMKRAMMSDALATTFGACVGSSTATTFVESSAGIAEGGRTGLTSLVTSILFLASIVIAPFVGVIPSAATAPALIFVGVLMMSAVKGLDFSDMSIAVPAFVTIAFMPFTYSIANGIAAGLVTYVLIKLFGGKAKEIKMFTVFLAVLFALRFAFMITG